MANKKNGPGDDFRAWITGQDNLGPMGKKWAKIVGTGLSTIGTAMGIQSRENKKNAFLKSKNITDYNKKLHKDEFKEYRKAQRALPKNERYKKYGGTNTWTRNSRITK